MQVSEKISDGLRRELKVVVGVQELGERFSARLDAVKDRVQLKGFRKGRVPVAHLKKVFGRSLMAEVVQQAVEETSQQALTDRKERPAFQPKIVLTEDKDELERMISGQADLAYDMAFEVLPDIEIADLRALKLERVTADIDDADIDKALGDLAERNVAYEAGPERAAGKDDRITVDFVGKIDGEPFEGGAGQGVTLVLGQGNFVPGFEDGLTGAKAGDDRVISAAFPADYPVKTLAGKAAVFDVKVTEVAKPNKPEINDEFAAGLGAENAARLREMVTARIRHEYDAVARARLKRSLLDELDRGHDFALPPSLVDAEFEGIWQQATERLKQAEKTFADEGKSEETARTEYRAIAERRVRLGLVIGEVGNKNAIQVSQDDLRRALVEQARRFPGQEKMVYEYFEKTPGALAELRAPIFEDKVVDFIIELVSPPERKVSREELFKVENEAS